MSKVNRLYTRKQAGDTIVEVVIAIAVIAVVLTGAFVVTNRSLTAVRDSEEHSEALNLLQGQVEQLRNAGTSIPSSDTNPGSPKLFCFDSSGILKPDQPLSSSCTQNTLYKLQIEACDPATCPPSSATPPPLTIPFLLTASWDSLSGGTDQVQLTYRVAVN